ncbi:MAG: DUF177 domain-containing protein [Candidatus Omnitrophica bacterium]|nr:DUF177 domain-containing protein [Candidatus Omnitrophota bacterium]MDD5574404.1 DUF177 domain-containing protein [Candidatus Omnitrophota bacterium]
MKIDLARLSEERPTHLSATWDPSSRELEVPGMRFEMPVKITVGARRDSALAVVQVDVAAHIVATCARCLRDFPTTFDKTFKLVYSLDLSDPVIELDDDIRQELILMYPQKILCRQDCRGICSRCGADLNTEGCRCK